MLIMLIQNWQAMSQINRNLNQIDHNLNQIGKRRKSQSINLPLSKQQKHTYRMNNTLSERPRKTRAFSHGPVSQG